MKRKIFLLLNFFFLSTYFLVAQFVNQQKNVTSLRIAIADTSNNYLFLKQEKLKEIWGVFQNNELHEIRLRYQEPDNEFWSSEYYDMNFDGDVYVFKKKYKNSIHFLKPKLDVQNIYGRTKQYLNSKQLRTVIRKDSVIFDFRLECLGEDMQDNVPNRNKLGVPAKYFGDLKKLSLSIEKQFAEINSPAEIDSIIVFRCVIDVSGDMSSLILEAGGRSAFSDAVKNALNSSQRTQTLKEPKRWVPARISRGPVKSNIRIYARLHKDGSVVSAL